MGLGSTAKKVQKLAETAEKLYSKLNEVREQVDEMRKKLDSTSERVEGIEREVAEQRALIEALAEEQGIDPAEVDVEATGTETGEGATEESDAKA